MINKTISIDIGSRNIRFLSGDQVVEVPCALILKPNKWNGKLTSVAAFGKGVTDREPVGDEVLVNPIRCGRIYDKRSAGMLLDNIFKETLGKTPRRRIGVVCFVACSLNSVERKLLANVLDELGFGKVELVEACCAVHSYIGNENTFSLDIGSDSTEIAVVSRKKILFACDLNVGVNRFCEDLAQYVSAQYGVTITKESAEFVYRRINTLVPYAPDVTAVSGLTAEGFTRQIELNSNDIFQSMKGILYNILEVIKVVWDGLPLELVDYFSAYGLHILGGGAMIRGMDEFFAQNLEVPIHRLDKGDEIIVLGGRSYMAR